MPFRRESPQFVSPGSERVRKALDSLLSDTEISVADISVLTEPERDEVAALTRTAHLAQIVLHADEPGQNAEAVALVRAQTALRNRVGAAAAPGADIRREGRLPTSWLGLFLDRLRDSGSDRR